VNGIGIGIEYTRWRVFLTSLLLQLLCCGSERVCAVCCVVMLRYVVYVVCCGDEPGIAVDWLANNLYWTDYTLNQVWMSRADGLYQKIIARNLSGPCNIVIDHTRKYVEFFANKLQEGFDVITCSTGAR